MLEDELGAAVVREEREARPLLGVSEKLLKNAVCSVPFDVVRVGEAMTSQRQRCEDAFRLVEVLVGPENEIVTDRPVELGGGSADDPLRLSVEVVPESVVFGALDALRHD